MGNWITAYALLSATFGFMAAAGIGWDEENGYGKPHIPAIAAFIIAAATWPAALVVVLIEKYRGER